MSTRCYFTLQLHINSFQLVHLLIQLRRLLSSIIHLELRQLLYLLNLLDEVVEVVLLLIESVLV